MSFFRPEVIYSQALRLLDSGVITKEQFRSVLGGDVGLCTLEKTNKAAVEEQEAYVQKAFNRAILDEELEDARREMYLNANYEEEDEGFSEDELARALFNELVNPEALHIAENKSHEAVCYVRDIMWTRTKPQEREECQMHAAALAAVMRRL